MIDREHVLPITKQAEAAGIARSTVYYLPRPVPAADLELMRQIDKLHLEFPFAGARMLRGLLAANGSKAGRRHVKTLMLRMGIEALYRRPRTTKPEPGHKIYPYLLRGMEIVRPNQVWAMDITYIPMAQGLRLSRRGARLVLAARAVVAAYRSRWRPRSASRRWRTHWRSTASPRSSIPIRAAQFTGEAFTGVLIENGIAISMDGKGAWRDNVFVERLWRSVKYEEVYLHAYDSVPRHAPRSGGISISTIAAARTRALTA